MWKRRHVYVLLYAAPALLLAIVVGAFVVAAGAGVFWLFLFGDDPWPAAADTLLTGAFSLTAAAVFLALSATAYTVGRQQEAHPTLNRVHVALALASTAVLAAVVLGRLAGVGAGGGGDTAVCADLCLSNGFAGSGMPPRDSGDRTCSCYDAQGREARRFPLDGGPSPRP